MDDLAARLLAAIEETEQRFTVPIETLRLDLIGQAAAWIARYTTPEQARDIAQRIADRVIPADATHIVADREAMLRHCAAHRRIVDMYLTEPRVEQEDNPHRIGAERMWGGGKLSGARIAVVLLADGYGLVKADDVLSEIASTWDAAHPDSKDGGQ